MPGDPQPDEWTPCRMRERIVHVCETHGVDLVDIGGFWRCPIGLAGEQEFFWTNGFVRTREGWIRD